MAEPDPHFEISPQVVYRLGEELISTGMQALIELLKNSYDADATRVALTIDTQARTSEGPGYIEIRDNGNGMDRTQIASGWLTISHSQKQADKAAGLTTTKGRTPLGDKGLGRLGAQRLGERVEIRTRPLDRSEEHVVSFRWRDFQNRERLSDVPVQVETAALQGPQQEATFARDVSAGAVRGGHGSTLRIAGLREPTVWEDRARLQKEMARLVSPYKAVKDFRILSRVDGESVDLEELQESLRSTARSQWTMRWDGEHLAIRGNVKAALVRPGGRKGREEYESLVASDHGAAFKAFLLDQPRATEVGLVPAEAPWLATFTRLKEVGDIAGLPFTRGELADCGPFTAEIDTYTLERGVENDSDVLATGLSDSYRDFVRNNAGIRVYRDGFGVPVDRDFLNLGGAFTTATGFYSLRPANTLGYVAISARDNSQLVETTSREGFRYGSAFEMFQALLGEFVGTINVALNLVGRGYNSFRVAHEPPPPPAERARDRAEEAARRAKDVTRAIKDKQAQTGATLDRLQSISDELPADAQAQIVEFDREFQELGAALEAAKQSVADVSALAEDIGGIHRETERLRDQLDEAYQTVGLGMVAEAVSHEITNIARRFEEHVATLAKATRGNDTASVAVEELRLGVRELRLQLRHLDPQLRYLRARRKLFDANEAVRNDGEYHARRLTPKGIRVAVAASEDPFLVKMNQGRLSQVLDNLILNSEYWLREASERGQAVNPTISIDVVPPTITVRDNGPGVEPAIENDLFEPFASGKAAGTGRGLGLYISRQLLETDGGSIALGEERDPDGRRRQFVIDLSGAQEGEE